MFDKPPVQWPDPFRSPGMSPTAGPSGAEKSIGIPDETLAYVREAISSGDMLRNKSSTASGPHQRVRARALIIAPLYLEYEAGGGRLLSTATDVKLIHQMLVRSGYEKANIRVLCDACSGFDCCADPTRENILSSLEWLVADTRAGDYRFLHFSGHGARVFGDSKSGKESLIVKTQGDKIVQGDSELDIQEEHPERIISATVARANLVYYNEYICTKPAATRPGEDPNNESKIWDEELNSYLSQLPERSTITCVMDCCCSGRILNLGTKWAGSGFRAKPNVSSVSAPWPDMAPGGTGQTGYFSMATLPERVIGFATSVFKRLIQYYPYVEMLENIPERERKMDGVKAHIFAWSACHQRQVAWEISNPGLNSSCGLLTYHFTQAYRNLSSGAQEFTYNQFFEEVSQGVYGSRREGTTPISQFVQLWTSTEIGNRYTQAEVLSGNVVLGSEE